MSNKKGKMFVHKAQFNNIEQALNYYGLSYDEVYKISQQLGCSTLQAIWHLTHDGYNDVYDVVYNSAGYKKKKAVGSGSIIQRRNQSYINLLLHHICNSKRCVDISWNPFNPNIRVDNWDDTLVVYILAIMHINNLNKYSKDIYYCIHALNIHSPEIFDEQDIIFKQTLENLALTIENIKTGLQEVAKTSLELFKEHVIGKWTEVYWDQIPSKYADYIYANYCNIQPFSYFNIDAVYAGADNLIKDYSKISTILKRKELELAKARREKRVKAKRVRKVVMQTS